MSTAPDRGDPEVRAAADTAARWRRERRRRVTGSLLTAACAVAAPVLAGPVLGEGGLVGAIVLAIGLLSVSGVLWPERWSPAEAEHHRLAAIWAQARPGTESPVAWTRFAVWAQAEGERVALVVVRRSPDPDATRPPSPYRVEIDSRIDAGDTAAAAEAMEHLRERSRRRESASRLNHEATLVSAAEREHAAALRRIDEATEAEVRRRDEELRRETAAAEAQERRGQAEAVARALRQP